MLTTQKKYAASSRTSHAVRTRIRLDPGPQREGIPQPAKIVTVLVVSPFEEDHLFLSHLFSHSNWKVHGADSCQGALALLRQATIPVVLCESEMPDSTWKGMLAELERLPDQPLLIVTSRLADENLWAEVLNLGGYDVLMKPFDRLEVIRVVSLAWLHWKNVWEQEHGLGALARAVASRPLQPD